MNTSPCFFGRLPERAYDLRTQGALIPRDIEVLGWLMRRAATGNNVVTERQEALAKRLRCVVKTIQRSLARLEEWGFLVRLYIRDARGYLRGRGYDVAATLAMLRGPSKRTPVTEGERRGVPAPSEARGVKTSSVQKDSADHLKRDLGIVCQADNGAQAETVTPPLVVELIKEGVGEKTAQTVHEKYGAERIRDVVNAARANRRATNRPGWIVAALTQGWAFQARREAQERPKAQMPYQQTWRGGVAPSEVRNPSRESFQQWRAAKLKKNGGAS